MRYNHNGVISKIYELPGNAQIAVFNYAFLPKHKRGKGKGKLAHQQRLETSRELGFDMALCTVVSSNATEKAILKRFGWEYLFQFHSSKSDNYVELWGRKLESIVDEPKIGVVDLDSGKPILSSEERSYIEWEKSLEGIPR